MLIKPKEETGEAQFEPKKETFTINQVERKENNGSLQIFWFWIAKLIEENQF